MLTDQSELLEGLDDQTALRVRSVLSEVSTHKKALTSFAHQGIRAANHTKYYELVYSTRYAAKSMNERKFVNFGPGTFKHKYWTNADKLLDGKTWSESRGKGVTDRIDVAWDMYAREPVTLADGEYEAAYCSHVIEHAWDEDVAFFLRDVWRILKPGGVLRLTAPNIDLGLRAARDKDFSYYAYPQFLRGDVAASRVFGSESERYPIEYFVLDQCSLIVNERNSTCLTVAECPAWLWQAEDVYATLDLASRLSDRELNHELARHVNWFTPAKAARMLADAGFGRVEISSYAQSICPVMRDVRYFDNTQPAWSFYIDAVK